MPSCVGNGEFGLLFQIVEDFSSEMNLGGNLSNKTFCQGQCVSFGSCSRWRWDELEAEAKDLDGRRRDGFPIGEIVKSHVGGAEEVTTRSIVTKDYSRILMNGDGEIREEAVVFYDL